MFNKIKALISNLRNKANQDDLKDQKNWEDEISSLYPDFSDKAWNDIFDEIAIGQELDSEPT